MAASETLSVRVSPELKAGLDKLAAGTRRTKSFLAAEALEAYVKRELAIVEAVQRGLDDVSAGRVVPQEEVEAGIEEVIRRAEQARRRA
jgi:predicted transcriptional regulator